MLPAFFIIAIAAAAILAIAAAINYFWQIGYKAASCYASFFVGLFLLFWASGLWENAARRGIGALFLMFVSMLAICAIAVLIGVRIWNKRKIGKSEDN